MATRIFELARGLGVTSKVVLEKCRAEDLDIKNHMSTVSAGLEATIREWFSESEADGTAVEKSGHVDLELARKEARKSRRRRSKKDEEDQAVAKALAEAEAEAKTESETPADEAEVGEAETVAEIATDTGEEVEPQAPVEAEQADEEPTPEAMEAEEPPAEDKPQDPKNIGPAGPQVVPKPAVLKGPRVIRVEKPDNLPPPRPRSRGPRLTTGRPTDQGGETSGPSRRGRGRTSVAPSPGGPGSKKTKRRSPRRRGSGRTADSGEKLKEWRNQDLQERTERLAAAGGGLRRRRANVSRKGMGGGSSANVGKVEIEEPISIKSLSAATGLKAALILKKMMSLGVMATVNQSIDREMAEAVVLDYDIELVVKEAKTAETEMVEVLDSRDKGELTPRAPVVTFLGHVDHGKTSLLDRIRKAEVAGGEAGGITQRIGAYRFEKGDTHVVFLDTPGHEAFTAMRSRGANMTDVVVLVVAADDGVMPQTAEAINHAKAAKVPIVVAMNKIDVPNANVQRALGQLAEHGLSPREWGGDTEVIQTSAETGEGIDALLETLSLEAELLELKAEVDAPASGYVIEAEMDPGMGVLSSMLVLDGTLKQGDIILAGSGFGRVRSIRDDHGRTITETGPATPVEVAGLSELPEAGDKFFVVSSLDQARAVTEQRRQAMRAKELATGPKMGLESMLSQIGAGKVNELALIVKADVQGSVEALTASLNKLGTDEAKLKILHAAAGGISTGDVTLAEASNALIIGFNVLADPNARQLAESKGITIRHYRVIYNILEDVRDALEKGLAPEIREEILGQAEVRQVFKVSRLGTIAGCFVIDGVVQRNAKVRISRNQIVIEDERTLDSLKRFKDDAREVRTGFECGLKIAGFDDIKEGDVLEFYRQIEVARTLDGK